MPKTATKEITKKELSASERFTQMILKEFANVSGNGIQLSPAKKKLAQHLFIKIDMELRKAEIDRQETGKKNRPPVDWANINLQKLVKDAIRRIILGLDAFIDNHIHIIPYFIENERKYEIDLQIGYVGKDYYRRNMAIDPPKDVRYELLYKNDVFKPIKKDINHEIESYEFSIPDPLNRGVIVGGFGYIIYEDPTKNYLEIITEEEFKKIRECAPSKKFWDKWPDRQRYKTIVNRTTAKLSPDPEKINESYLIIERDDQEERILAEIEEKANKKIIDIKPETEENESQGNELDDNEKDSTGPTETKTESIDEGPGF